MESTCRTILIRVGRMLVLLTSIFFVSAGVQVRAQSPPPPQELGEANRLMQERRFSEALPILKKVVRENKDLAEGWYALGLVQIQLNDLKNAQSAFENATLIQPRFGQAQTALAYTYLRRGKLKEGMTAANTALEIQPDNANAHYTLGVILFRNGDRTQALLHAEMAIESNPKLAEAYLLKSQALVVSYANALWEDDYDAKESRASRFRRAAEALETYLNFVPNSAADLGGTARQFEILRRRFNKRDSVQRKGRNYQGSSAQKT